MTTTELHTPHVPSSWPCPYLCGKADVCPECLQGHLEECDKLADLRPIPMAWAKLQGDAHTAMAEAVERRGKP